MFTFFYACNNHSKIETTKTSNSNSISEDSVEFAFATESELEMALKDDSINAKRLHDASVKTSTLKEKVDIKQDKVIGNKINIDEMDKDDIGRNLPVQDQTFIYRTEQMPLFPGGDIAMMQYIKENLRYPSELKNQSIEGITHVYFVVEKNGTLTSISIQRTSGHEAFDNEAIRLIASMPKFTPGKNLQGETTKTPCSIPITFEIEN